MALRRLGKPAWMLNYNDEGHGLRRSENRLDFAKRMQQFFDHHLMGAPATEWITDGVPATEKGRNLGLEVPGEEPVEAEEPPTEEPETTPEEPEASSELPIEIVATGAAEQPEQTPTQPEASSGQPVEVVGSEAGELPAEAPSGS